MAILPILTIPDPRLRQVSKPVMQFDAGLRERVGDLVDTLYSTRAIGLSANQVGFAERFLVMDLSAERNAAEVYINPDIEWRNTIALVQESCLSVPDVSANVRRAIRLLVRYQDLDGQAQERELADLHAVCLQHELDHLDGKLFVDRLPWLERWRLRRRGLAAA
jgi:peptide deformylase